VDAARGAASPSPTAGRSVVSTATDRVDFKGLWAEVKANRAKLDGCARHRFEAKPVKLGEKQICLMCGGTISLTDMGNYIRGYEAAGGSADDIWPGYRGTVELAK
jgi:hypothetical protein